MVDDAEGGTETALAYWNPFTPFLYPELFRAHNSMHLTWPIQHAAEECCQLGKGEGK